MYDFDKFPDRADSDSVKWHEVSGSVLPMWVADMDFESAPPVVKAIQERAMHPYFGYPYTQELLKDHIIAHYKKKYNVTVKPEWIVWVPSVIPGVVTALQMMGGKFMYSIPMYDHIRNLHKEAGLPVVEVPMKRDANNRYTMDMDALEAVYSRDIKCLILCNPHNPVGRVYTKEELLRLEAFCTSRHLLVISD